jgi:hypothetical protein
MLTLDSLSIIKLDLVIFLCTIYDLSVGLILVFLILLNAAFIND